ncbi:MAG: leucine-rich repeat domain-containing protein [Candidatus Latescibacterota bacterium]
MREAPTAEDRPEDLVSARVLAARQRGIGYLAGLELLPQLVDVDLSGNDIEDLHGLEGATALEALDLSDNLIHDAGPLAGLVHLVDLDLSGNQIQDVSPLTGLGRLRRLDLAGNAITDISPLVESVELGPGDVIDLKDNPLSAEAHARQVPALRERGVRVRVGDPKEASRALVLTTEVEQVVRAAVGKADGPLCAADVARLTRLSGYLWRSAGLQGIGQLKRLVDLDLSHCGMEDPSFLAVLSRLRRLRLPGNAIAHVDALAHLQRLSELDLSGNAIEDVAALSGLVGLVELRLGGNKIGCVAPLAGLTRLRKLHLECNRITDPNALSGLPRLVELNLSGNQVSDVSALAGLVHLRHLDLSANRLADIAPLVEGRGLGQGATLDLRGNRLLPEAYAAHIPALQGRGVRVHFDPPGEVVFADGRLEAAVREAAGKQTGPLLTSDLRGVTALRASGQAIADLGGIAALVNVTELDLSDNAIHGIAPLAAHEALGAGARVDLRGNPLSLASHARHIPQLQARGVVVACSDGGLDVLRRVPDTHVQAVVYRVDRGVLARALAEATAEAREKLCRNMSPRLWEWAVARARSLGPVDHAEVAQAQLRILQALEGAGSSLAAPGADDGTVSRAQSMVQHTLAQLEFDQLDEVFALMAEIVRRIGFLPLDGVAASAPDPFLRSAIELLVDHAPERVVAETLDHQMRSLRCGQERTMWTLKQGVAAICGGAGPAAVLRGVGFGGPVRQQILKELRETRGAVAPHGQPGADLTEKLRGMLQRPLGQMGLPAVGRLLATLAVHARDRGILAWEGLQEATEERFLREAIAMAVDGVEPGLLSSILEDLAVSLLYRQQRKCEKVLRGVRALSEEASPREVRELLSALF